MEEKNKPNHYYISLPTQKTEEDIIDFEMKMLEQNRIRGLLPAAREYQDTEVKIYFDISGRQNLEQRYAWQKLTGGEVKQILHTIAEVAAELEEYMLDFNHLNLMPEYIYGMLDPGDLCFCYEPWDSETFAERLRPLALWFLDHMDYREREEVIFSYEFQRFCEENDVSPALLGQFMAGKAGGEKRRSSREFRNWRESVRTAEKTETEKKSQPEGVPAAAEEEETDGTFGWEEPFPDMAGKKNGGMKELLRRIFPAGGKRYPDFSSEGSLRFAEDETEYGRETRRGREKAKSGKTDEFFRPGRGGEKAEKDFQSGRSEGEMYQTGGSAEEMHQTGAAAENAFFGGTEEEEAEELPVLGELRSEKMPTLLIHDFPCFLGSDGELTDCEIADGSVSRIHARLYRSDGSIWVEDLRSENGTFLNGDRMLPNEPWALKPGDELKFGKCLYRFRLGSG